MPLNSTHYFFVSNIKNYYECNFVFFFLYIIIGV
nr:MAG TPA: hypothetical protein [Caudoviricetes sp.]